MSRQSPARALHRVVLAALTCWSALAGAAPGDTELVSVTTNGTAAGRAAEWDRSSAVSADGRFVAFVSPAPNIVPGDTNAATDVFVRDRLDGTVERVSVSSSGGQGNGDSNRVDLSGDGRYVVFESGAWNLVAGDTNGRNDIFVHDRQAGTTERVSVSSTGAQANSFSTQPSISRDGQVVGFVSFASNLVTDDTNRENDVFVHVRGTGVTERVSVGSNEQQGTGGSLEPSLSANGRFVAFTSGVAVLVPGDTNGWADVFVRDRLNGTTERVSVSSGGVQGDLASRGPSISGDGRYVAFESDAFNLIDGPGASFTTDIFVRDRVSGQTELVSVAAAEVPVEKNSRAPEISADGRYVAFVSDVTDLVAGDTNGMTDVFWRDRVAGETERASVATNGAQGNGPSTTAAISADGLHVAFVSNATNLVAGDSNASPDVYLHEPGGPSGGPEDLRWSLLPKFQSFGIQTVDTFRWRRFNLENLGNVPLPFSATLIGRDATSFKIGNSCRSPLAVGKTCSFVVFFHPMTVGDKAAQLRVVVGNDVRDRPLSGTGVPGSFTVSPTSIAFGGIAVGSASDARIVTVTNIGQGLLPIEAVRLDGARPGQFTRYNGCKLTLRAGESCRVTVYFVPKLQGPLSARLVVDAGGLTDPKSVTLTGKGL